MLVVSRIRQMADQAIDPVVERLRAVESHLQSINLRVGAIERTLGMAVTKAVETPPVAPPVIFVPPPEPPRFQPVVTKLNPDPKPTPVAREISEKWSDELESKIGRIGLRWGGALMIVLAMIYMVALAISRGYITPTIQFGGELALCFTFIAVGLIKHNEREEFGQLLVGIGSCGLYLSFAGGDLAKHLYGDRILVGSFVLLSLLNLAFSWWRSSRSFLGIGMIGGLVASVMPMHEHNQVISVVLHFLILVPAALTVAKNRWMPMAAAMAIASILALCPVVFYNSHWELAVGALFASGLVGAVTYALDWKDNHFDPICSFSGLVLFAAGGLSMVISLPHHSSLPILILAIAAAAIGWVLKGSEASKQVLTISGLALATILGPVGFHSFPAGLTYAAITIGLGFAAGKVSPKALSILAGVEWALCVGAYFVPWFMNVPAYTVGEETIFLLSLVLATGAWGYGSIKAGPNTEHVSSGAALLLFPMVLRLGSIQLQATHNHFSHTVSLFAPALMFSVILLTLGKQRSWWGLISLGVLGVAGSMGTYLLLVLDGKLTLLPDTTLLTLLLLSAIYVGRCLYSKEGDTAQVVISGCGLVVSTLIFRLVFVWSIIPSHFVGWSRGCIIAGIVVSCIGSACIYRLKWNSLIAHIWVALTIAALMASRVHHNGNEQPLLDAALALLTLATFYPVVVTTAPFDQTKKYVTGGTVFLIWLILSKLSIQILGAKLIGLKPDPAMSFGWTAYAVTLMALGFKYKARYLRYWGIGVFTVTLAKVFMVDLSALDSGIRVGVLMLLGLGMLGAGYWYIKNRPSEQALPTKEEAISEPED